MTGAAVASAANAPPRPSEGARIVVNDPGVNRTVPAPTPDPLNKSSKRSEAGGQAVANLAESSMEGGESVTRPPSTPTEARRPDQPRGPPRDRMVFNLTEKNGTTSSVSTSRALHHDQPAAVVMRQQRYGRIVNSARPGLQGNSGQAKYGAAKAGVAGLTKSPPETSAATA